MAAGVVRAGNLAPSGTHVVEEALKPYVECGELKHWAVQQIGLGETLGEAKNTAVDRFFATKADNTQLESFTGRTEDRGFRSAVRFHGRKEAASRWSPPLAVCGYGF